MCVRWDCYLVCTRCNNQFYSRERDNFVRGKSAAEVREIARGEGWVYRKVANGSMWDFCPLCWMRHQDEQAELAARTDAV